MVRIVSNTEVWNVVLAAISPAARRCVEKSMDPLHPPPFQDFVLNAIEADAGTGKAGPLSMVLLGGVVAAAIANPAILTLEEAIRLARSASRIETGLDYKILTHLTRTSHNWPTGVPRPEIMRVLMVIDVISDCKRLALPLMKFAKLEQPHLRSKAVKLLARANRNPAWADLILADPNPRVRSNLIEEIAARIGPKAETLLRKGARDPHHRVAVTSLLGLCRLGDEPSLASLKKLAASGDQMHQRAAAWALGQLDQPDRSIPSTTAPHPIV